LRVLLRTPADLLAHPAKSSKYPLYPWLISIGILLHFASELLRSSLFLFLFLFTIICSIRSVRGYWRELVVRCCVIFGGWSASDGHGSGWFGRQR